MNINELSKAGFSQLLLELIVFYSPARLAHLTTWFQVRQFSKKHLRFMDNPHYPVITGGGRFGGVL
jgi:hypothetical protein